MTAIVAVAHVLCCRHLRVQHNLAHPFRKCHQTLPAHERGSVAGLHARSVPLAATSGLSTIAFFGALEKAFNGNKVGWSTIGLPCSGPAFPNFGLRGAPNRRKERLLS